MNHAFLFLALVASVLTTPLATQAQGVLTLDNGGLRNTYRVRFDYIDTRQKSVRGSLEILGDDDGRVVPHTKLPFTGMIRPADDGSGNELLELQSDLFAAFSPPASRSEPIQGRLFGRLEPDPGLVLELWTIDGISGKWVKGPMRFGNVPSGPDIQSLLDKTTIGGLRLGMPEDTMRQMIKAPMFRGEQIFAGATGLWMMEVVSPTLGLKMQISSATKDGTGQIESIAISDASPLTTDRGIGIGSTRERVEAEYNDYYNPDDSSTQVPEEFVAGSVYGGIIFSIDRGRVSGIFLGAAAE